MRGAIGNGMYLPDSATLQPGYGAVTNGAYLANEPAVCTVIPANAGIQGFEQASVDRPIPANKSFYRHANESRHPERFFKNVLDSSFRWNDDKGGSGVVQSSVSKRHSALVLRKL